MINVEQKDLPMRVWVESELGMLGRIEKTEMWLMDLDFDIPLLQNIGIVKVNALQPCEAHRVAMEEHKIAREVTRQRVQGVTSGLGYTQTYTHYPYFKFLLDIV